MICAHEIKSWVYRPWLSYGPNQNIGPLQEPSLIYTVHDQVVKLSYSTHPVVSPMSAEFAIPLSSYIHFSVIHLWWFVSTSSSEMPPLFHAKLLIACTCTVVPRAVSPSRRPTSPTIQLPIKRASPCTLYNYSLFRNNDSEYMYTTCQTCVLILCAWTQLQSV